MGISPAALLPVARCSVGLFLRSGCCRGRSLGCHAGDRTLRAPVAGRLRAKKNHFLPLAAFRPQAPRAVAFRQCTCALAFMLPSSRCSNLSRPRSGRRLRRPLFLAAAGASGGHSSLPPLRLAAPLSALCRADRPAASAMPRIRPAPAQGRRVPHGWTNRLRQLADRPFGLTTFARQKPVSVTACPLGPVLRGLG